MIVAVETAYALSNWIVPSDGDDSLRQVEDEVLEDEEGDEEEDDEEESEGEVEEDEDEDAEVETRKES